MVSCTIYKHMQRFTQLCRNYLNAHKMLQITIFYQISFINKYRKCKQTSKKIKQKKTKHFFFFTLRVIKYWNRLPREIVKIPSLDTCQTWWKTALSKLVFVTLLWARVWTRWSPEVLYDLNNLMFLSISPFNFPEANFLHYSMMGHKCFKEIICLLYVYFFRHHKGSLVCILGPRVPHYYENKYSLWECKQWNITFMGFVSLFFFFLFKLEVWIWKYILPFVYISHGSFKLSQIKVS